MQVKVRATALGTLEQVGPVITSRRALAAVKPPFTNHPADKVHNLILPMALKEEQNQFQKANSVSLAIKSILLINELQHESIFHVRDASYEQRSQSTSSFLSGTLWRLVS